MKKLLSLILASLMLFSVLFAAVSCGDDKKSEETASVNEETKEETKEEIKETEAPLNIDIPLGGDGEKQGDGTLKGTWEASLSVPASNFAESNPQSAVVINTLFKGVDFIGIYELVFENETSGNRIISMSYDESLVRANVPAYLAAIGEEDASEQEIEMLFAMLKTQFSQKQTNPFSVEGDRLIFDDPGQNVKFELNNDKLIVYAPEASTMPEVFPLTFVRKG